MTTAAADEARFRALVLNNSDVVVVVDVAGIITYVSPSLERVFGLAPETLISTQGSAFLHPDDLDATANLMRALEEEAGSITTARFRIRAANDEWRWVEASASNLGHVPSVGGVVLNIRDITERIHSEREREKLVRIFEATEDLVGIVDRHGYFEYMNSAGRQFFGIELDQPVQHLPFSEVAASSGLADVVDTTLTTLWQDGIWTGELTVSNHDGVKVPMLAQFIHHRFDDGTAYYSAAMRDLSGRKDAEERLEFEASHDPLTGLPNRAMLQEHLTRSLRRSRRLDQLLAVLFLDLDHFKVINDSLGHSVGDELLIAVVHRLRDHIRPSDTLARFGGDEFVLLCEDLESEHDAELVAGRVSQALEMPFDIAGQDLYVGVSIGIATSLTGASSPESLIRDADAAMYRAKERGRSQAAIFDRGMRDRAVDRLAIESSLRQALDNRELRVHHQPIHNLETGDVAGSEALLRWEHPERGLLSPGDFIGVAEDTGLIVPIGAWVVRHVCHQVQRWSIAASPAGELFTTVNLSARQLTHPNLVEEIQTAIEDSGISSGALALEITESVLMEDAEQSGRTLRQLDALGIPLAIDDFGTGYSSLAYLRQFPIQVLKIDRSFVMSIEPDGDWTLVEAIIRLAETLGLRTVAEGIETPYQLAQLRALGCRYGQGFHLARPMPADAFESYVSSGPLPPGNLE